MVYVGHNIVRNIVMQFVQESGITCRAVQNLRIIYTLSN